MGPLWGWVTHLPVRFLTNTKLMRSGVWSQIIHVTDVRTHTVVITYADHYDPPYGRPNVAEIWLLLQVKLRQTRPKYALQKEV